MSSNNARLKDQYKQIGNGVWSWENFLSKEELVAIMEEINSKAWTKENFQNYDFTTLSGLSKKIFNSLNMPNSVVPDIDKVVARFPGKGMQPHVDVQNFFNIVYYNEIPESDPSPKEKVYAGRYSFIIYFNDDYIGGEISYPDQGISHKPKAGELIMHDVRSVHAVKKVQSGIRYSHAAQIQDDIWVPKSIYDSIDWPSDEERDFPEDPRYFYAAHHGKSENPALSKFMETYEISTEYGD